MIRICGEFFLYLAFFFALLQSIVPIFALIRKKHTLAELAKPITLFQTSAILISYLFLTFAFLQNDFSIAYVAANSHQDLPFMYRLTGLWGGHEGSILLWVFLLSAWSLIYLRQRLVPADPLVLALLGIITFGFLSFLIFTSNPFLLNVGPQVGHDLNPLLQDPGFVIHPPMLYMGYVGFSVAFALTQAALIYGKLDRQWALITKQFVIAAWCFLTFGILLGSWWSYRVLGWGGFWFWDPVENASLLPWLAGTALLHILILVERRGVLTGWAVLLAIITFAMSILGTFLVRSGVLVSVHTFASDPSRGVALLSLLIIMMVITFFIYLVRGPKLISEQHLTFAFFSREFMLIVNSALLFLALLIILLGTLYPLILDVLHLGVISVGAPYFNSVLLPLVLLMLVLMFAIAVNTFNKWRTFIAMTIAHSGFVIFLLGIFLSSFLSQEKELSIKLGNSFNIGPYQFFFIDIKSQPGPNYRGIRATFEVLKNKHHIAFMEPEKRIYPVREMIMSKVAIHPGIFRDLYIALGSSFNDNDWQIRVYYKPFIRWIWLGGIIMILGGLTSLYTKRKSFLTHD